MPVPDLDVARVRRYCENKIPVHFRSEVRIECEVRDSTVTVVECRPPLLKDRGPEWTRLKAAQLRFDAKKSQWSLYSADRNERWHFYDLVKPTPRIDVLLKELDRDPTGIFWG